MRRSTESGLALVLVLWSLVLLTTIGLGFGYAARVETAGGLALADQVRAEAVAAGGVRRAIAGLIVEDTRLRWAADGIVRELPWPDAILRASVRPESAKIDLNSAPRELLMGLFANLMPGSDAGTLAEAVLLRRESGAAEATAQASAEPRPTRPARGERAVRATEQNEKPSQADQPFATVDELAQVPGFDGATIQRLRPYLTVYSGSAKVDAATADVEVLAAIPGVTRDSAERFARDRMERVAESARLDLATLGAGTNYVEARAAAKVTNVRAMAYLRGGATATVEAVLAPGGSEGFTLLEWREGAPLAGAEWVVR